MNKQIYQKDLYVLPKIVTATDIVIDKYENQLL